MKCKGPCKGKDCDDCFKKAARKRTKERNATLLLKAKLMAKMPNLFSDPFASYRALPKQQAIPQGPQLTLQNVAEEVEKAFAKRDKPTLEKRPPKRPPTRFNPRVFKPASAPFTIGPPTRKDPAWGLSDLDEIEEFDDDGVEIGAALPRTHTLPIPSPRASSGASAAALSRSTRPNPPRASSEASAATLANSTLSGGGGYGVRLKGPDSLDGEDLSENYSDTESD